MTADAPKGRSVVHVVRSDSFAGVERYVCDVATALHERGWPVAVVGGDPSTMRTELPQAVRHLAAPSTLAVAHSLVGLGRIGIVHAHMTAAETAAVATRPRTRARIVSTRHFAARRGSTALGRALGSVVRQGIEREVAISAFVGAAVGHDAVVLHNGVRDRPPTPSAAAPPRTILVMQRLEPEKDTGLAIRAFARSGLASRGWQLRIAGRGRGHDALVALAEHEGVAASVSLAGFVGDADRERSSAAVFLATAPAEPFGLSLVEAMACGLPVLAARGGAHQETVGDAGLFFACGDVEDCARGLRSLATDEALRRQLGQRARDRQQRLFSLGRHVDGLEQLYRELLR